jgi:hypothetical protein
MGDIIIAITSQRLLEGVPEDSFDEGQAPGSSAAEPQHAQSFQLTDLYKNYRQWWC